MVGRTQEQAILRQAIESKSPELIAIYGRRRVGKTYLIRQFYNDLIVFEFSGLHDSNLGEHMREFARKLHVDAHELPPKIPASWFEAFHLLKKHIGKLNRTRKKVVFLDEVPWMATNRSRFLSAFESFWNGWASAQKDLVVVICGSASSWMIKKILNNTGGLYNRTTRHIHLHPFTLAECELFLEKQKTSLTRYQITQIYMVMGGIPHYLKEIRKGESAAQAIDRIYFSKTGLLNQEFENIYDALFSNSERHKEIVKALALKPRGLQRDDLLKRTRMSSGGGFTTVLKELMNSGFISEYVPFGKKARDAVFKLTDNFSLFHQKYMVDRRGRKVNWNAIAQSSTWQSWSGLAFENICMFHIEEIKYSLNISGIHSSAHFWHHPGNDEIEGSQVDLLIDRADEVINLCEIKFSGQPYTITKSYAQKLRRRIGSFQHLTKTRKALFLTMIVSQGLTSNKYSLEMVQNVIELDDLFTRIKQ